MQDIIVKYGSKLLPCQSGLKFSPFPLKGARMSLKQSRSYSRRQKLLTALAEATLIVALAVYVLFFK